MAIEPLAETGDRMKLSTMCLPLCFALSPFAARAMAQRRDVLRQMQRQAMPISAIVFPATAKLGDDYGGLLRNCSNIDSNNHF
jgi:hypothetical protein